MCKLTDEQHRQVWRANDAILFGIAAFLHERKIGAEYINEHKAEIEELVTVLRNHND